ncbi:MAG: alpha/beta hydrolase [Bacillota bacterium]
MSIWLGISIVTIVAIISIYIYFAFKMVYSLNHPQRFDFGIKADLPCEYKKFDISTHDGFKLKGIDYVPHKKQKGVILICHYLGGSKEAILQFVESLIINGYRIISFDFRNHGESDNDLGIRYSLKKDFDAFYNAVSKLKIDGPIGIMGFSMGATPALVALDKYPQVKAAIVDSGPLLFVKEYFYYVLENKREKNPIIKFLFVFIYLHYVGFSRMSKSTIEVLRKIKGKPIMYIHGIKDNIIHLKNAEYAYELTKSELCEFIKVENSRHLTNQFLMKGNYDEKILRFFNKHLCNEE